MKKSIFLASVLVMSLWAVDFSQISTEELMSMRGSVPVEDRDAFRAEMQKRLQTMTPEEIAAFRASRQANPMGARGVMGANAPKFSDLDKDGDGKITQAELEAARAARMEAKANEGRLLKNAGNAPDFATLDANKDGVIDASEFQTHQTAQMQARQAQRAATQQGMRAKGQMQGASQGIQQRLQDGSASGQMLRGAHRGTAGRP